MADTQEDTSLLVNASAQNAVVGVNSINNNFASFLVILQDLVTAVDGLAGRYGDA